MAARLTCRRAQGLIRQGLASPGDEHSEDAAVPCGTASQATSHILNLFLFFFPGSLLRKHLLCPKPTPELKIKIKDFCLFIKHFSKRDYYIHIIFPCFVQTRLSQH